MPTQKQIILILAILVFTVLSALVLIKLKSPPKTTPYVQTPITIEAVAVTPRPYTLILRSQGRIRSHQALSLNSEVSGRVIWLSAQFNEGQSLPGDTLLAKIDQTPYLAQLAQAQASLAQAELALAEEQARAAQAEADWASLHTNDTHSKATPLVLRQPQLASAKAQVKAAQTALAEAQRNLDHTEIRLPFDAVIDSRQISLGQFVNIGTVVASLLGQQREIRLPLTPQQHNTLEPTQTSITLHQGHQYWPAHLSHIDANVDPDTQITYLTATLPMESNAPIGLFVEAEISALTVARALVLPSSAHYRDRDNRDIIYQLHNTDQKLMTLEPQTITVLEKTQDKIVIDLDQHPEIAAHSKVLITALPLVTPGMPVQLATPSL